jgi:hypothetical protein
MATQPLLGSRRNAGVPSPLVSAAPLLALAVVALALDAAPRLPWVAGVAVAGLFAAAGLVRLGQQWLVVRRLRSVADRLILRGRDHTATSPLIAWRSVELTSAQHRHAIAGDVTRLAHELDASRLPGAVPLNRAAVRPFRQELEALAARLDGPDPVTARGMLLAQQLVSNPASPLYDRDAAERLGPTLRRVMSTLEI